MHNYCCKGKITLFSIVIIVGESRSLKKSIKERENKEKIGSGMNISFPVLNKKYATSKNKKCFVISFYL
jgi:hypothetical protein